VKDQEVTKQHFVPRTYLKHFGQPEKGQDKIYRTLSSDPDATHVRQVSVAHACFQNDLYTLEGDSGAERMALENFYRISVEDHFDTVRQLLLDEKQMAAPESLRSKVLHTVATMLMRTTKILARNNEVVDRVLAQMMMLCEQTGQDTFDFDGETYSIKGKTLDELRRQFRQVGQQGRVLTQLELALRLGQAKQNDFAILVVTLDEAAGEYITSDNPVVIWSLDRHNVAFNPDAALKLPLGPRHMLNLMPTTVDMLKNRITRWNLSGDQAKLERISANIIQHNNSERWILGSEVGVQQHVKERVTLQHDLDNPTENTAKQDITSRMKRLGFL
jgi:hypothetical protein